MKHFKKLLSALLAIALLPGSALAADVTKDVTTTVSVESEAAIFSVTIPTTIPVGVAADGTVTVADKISIRNDSPSPVAVTSAKVEAMNGWTLEDFASADYDTFDVGKKTFALQIDGVNVNATTGLVNIPVFGNIAANSTTDTTYAAKVPMQKVAVDQQIAKVTFIIGWWDNPFYIY